MPTRAQDARARRIGDDALATAAAAVERGQAWRDAVENRAATEDAVEKQACGLVAEREACMLDGLTASLAQVGIESGLVTRSDRDRFAADHPELDTALKALEAAAKAARDVSNKRGVQDPKDWAWLDALERAGKALGEVLRAATEGKPAAKASEPTADPWVYGYKTELCRHLGYSDGYQVKLDELVELRAINLEPLEGKRKRHRWRMLVLKPEIAFNRSPNKP